MENTYLNVTPLLKKNVRFGKKERSILSKKKYYKNNLVAERNERMEKLVKLNRRYSEILQLVRESY